MAPSNPKRPPRPPRPPGASASKKEDVELPFDDDEVAPLQEDDPRPQRVPQFPAGPRRSPRGSRGGPREGTKDRELATRFDTNEYSDPGYAPVFLYVEKGPGTGQLIPVKQGPLVIGRASACDLRLQHPSISRRHAQIMRQGERFLLRDLGSQNGTFVNKTKVTADQEIKVGDELSLGNAVMKLRGSGVSSDKIPEVTAPSSRAPARSGTSLTRVALIAAAVGSAVAALLMLTFLKFSSPNRPVSAAPARSPESAPPAKDSAPPKEADAYVPPPPAAEEEHQAATEEESERAAKPLQPPAETRTSVDRKSSGPRASNLSAKALVSRKESGSRSSAKGGARQQASKEPARASEKANVANVDSAEIISLYEKGDVDGALSLARAGKVEPLATKLARFQSARAAGEQAMKAQDTAVAIQQFTDALVLDQQLSQGWGQGPDLRKKLARLYTQAGQQQLKTGTRAAAREAFEMALKYDPANASAKTQLQQLGGQK